MALFIGTVLRTEIVTGYKCPNLPQCNCNKEITSVDCSYQYLTSIPAIPVTALHLDLIGNFIHTIPSGAFSKLLSLQSLKLSFNKIKIIEPSAFEGLEKLTDIDLSENSIDPIPTLAFSKLTKLQSLDLGDNQIRTIEPTAFEGLESLTDISLYFNNIDTIPTRAFSKLTKLQSLDLGRNQIKTIEPTAFEGLESLTDTSLHFNNIDTIPTRAFSKLTKLQSLDLGDNEIKTIEPYAFDGLESLTDISLHLNYIDTIPTRAFSKLTKLQRLDLSFNQVQIIEPFAFDGLESLTDINLHFNYIDTIPTRAFSKLTKLQSLDLGDNEIKTIEPYAFDGLESLTDISLHLNNIDTIPTRAFSKLTKLQRLALSDNRVQIIEPFAFDGLESLIDIDLERNLLSEVPSVGSQSCLSKLLLSRNRIVNATFPSSYRQSCNLTLDLSRNNIKTLDNLTFSSLAGSTILDMKLAFNDIDTVAPGTFDRIKSIQNLELQHNSLNIEALSNIADGLSRKQLTFLDLSGVFRTQNMLHAGLSVFMKIRTYNINLGLCSDFKSITSEVALEEYRNILIIRVTKEELFQFSESEFSGSKNLMWISFAANRLTLFPQFLPESLEFLDLRENRITNLEPRKISYLGKLKRLILSNNNIDYLGPNAFDGLRNLQVLDLAQNHISFVAASSYEPLQNLTHLYLGNNKLDVFDRLFFDGLVSLRVLDLSNNDCEEIPGDIFRSLVALRALHLGGNNLGKYVFESRRGDLLFRGLTELEEISISSNHIRYLSGSVFRDQESLKVLKINNNKLSGWGTYLFKFTKNLAKLDLSHNLITVLTESNLHDLDNLQELDLTGNPFVCNCDLLWFREWLDKTSIVLPDKRNYTCNAPEEWRGRPLHDFTKDKIDCRSVPIDAIAGSVSAALFICISTGIAVYKNRWRLRLRLYLLCKRGRLFLTNTRQREQRANYGAINDDRAQGFYDAYISSSENDDDWVLHHLLPGVDNGRYDDNIFGGDFKLYHDARDQDPGVSAIANIHEHLSRSTKMIVVLTQHYVNDGMNKFELDQATTMFHNDELDDIIVIKVGNVPARKVPVNLYTQMRRGMFLEWDANEVAVETFKEKLKDRLHGTGVELC